MAVGFLFREESLRCEPRHRFVRGPLLLLAVGMPSLDAAYVLRRQERQCQLHRRPPRCGQAVRSVRNAGR